MRENFVKHPFLIVLGILIASFSCTKKKSDPSLSLEEYSQLGVPDINGNWKMSDYIEAHNALAKLKWERPLDLPRKNSEKSGPLFRHMLSLDYISFLKDSTLSLSEKARRVTEFRTVHDYWTDVYSNPVINPAVYSRENIAIKLFNIQLTEAIVNLGRKVQASDDPEDIALRPGYKSIKRAYLAYMMIYLQPANFRAGFPEDDLKVLTDSIHHSVLRNTDWMDSSELAGLRSSLRALGDSAASPGIRDKFRYLEKSLASSTP